MSSHSKFGKYISVIYRFTHIHIKKEFEKYGLGSGQSPFLFTLFENDGISLDELTKVLQVDKATTTRSIKKLEKNGFVIRKQNPDDKRSYNIHLTDKSHEFNPMLRQTMKFIRDIMFENLSQEEIDCTMKSLKIMSENLSNYTRQNGENYNE